MRRVSFIWCCSIASCLFDLLSEDISDWELPALAFFVEVSPMASAAELSYLPAPCPPRDAAAWHGARALCCCLGSALCTSELLPAGHPCPCSVPFRSWIAWT